MTTWAVVLTCKEDSTPRKVWLFEKYEDAVNFEREVFWGELVPKVECGKYGLEIVEVSKTDS